MMCEHELEEVISGQLRCIHCKKYESQILREQLAAAKAELAELEKERNNYLSFGQGGASFSDSQWLDKLATTEQRAEQAEAQRTLALQVVEQYAPKKNCVLVVGHCREGCTAQLYHLPDHAGVWECSECSYPNADNDLIFVEITESDELKALRGTVKKGV